MDSMSKKERLARGSAVIKVMRVNPRPGHFLKTYIEPHKMPKKAKQPIPKGMSMAALEMPHLVVKDAAFQFSPDSAKVLPPFVMPALENTDDLCGLDMGDSVKNKSEEKILPQDPSKIGLPDGDKQLSWFGYREWAYSINPPNDGNVAEHFNILLGMLITMSEDPENENFPDTEAYPAVQFLRTIRQPDGEIPTNTASLISYIEYICNKMIEEG